MNPGTKYFWTSGRMCNFDVLGQEVVAVTAIKVAHSSRGPEVFCSWVHDPFEEVVLSLIFDGDEVHAPLAAVVPGVEPVPVGVLQAVVVAQPRHPVQVVSEPYISLSVHSVLAELSIREAEESLLGVLVPAAVPGVDLVLAGGDGLLGASDPALGVVSLFHFVLVRLLEKVWHLGQVEVLHQVVSHVLHLLPHLLDGLEHGVHSVLEGLEEASEPALVAREPLEPAMMRLRLECCELGL